MRLIHRHPIIEEDLDQILSASLPWDRFAGKTVLVAGAAGFLPAYMVETLLRLNEQGMKPVRVVALVRNLDRAQNRFAHLAGRGDLILRAHDVRSPLDWDEAADFIVHAASPATPRHFSVDPLGTFEANVEGCRHLLKIAHDRVSEGFLFFSSGEVYGRGNDEFIPTGENAFGFLDPTLIRSCYGEGKRAAETLCACWRHQHGVPTRIVRPFHTYGPGMALDDGRVFADFVSDALVGRDIQLKSEGTASRAFCYLADATLGFFTVLLKGEVGGAYNVGNDQAEIQIRDLAQCVANLRPELGLKVIRQARTEGDAYMPSPIQRGCPDVSRLRALGWNPTYGVAEGFSRTIRSYQ
jgi:UDP-glucuronate decarboxylase